MNVIYIDREVAPIHSSANTKAGQHIGEAQWVRPMVGGQVLAEIKHQPGVAEALLERLDIPSTLQSPGKITITPTGSAEFLLTT
jgi:hypothetical protein